MFPFLDRLLDSIALRAAQRVYRPSFFNDPTGMESDFPSMATIEAQVGAYEWSTALTAGLQALASIFKVAEFHVQRLEGEKRIEIANHEAEQLLNNPNEIMTRSDFREAALCWRLLAGHCAIWLNRKKPDEKPVEMWILPAYEVRPHPDGRLSIDGYIYTPSNSGDEPHFIPKWQMLFWKGFNPSNPFVGTSFVNMLANPVLTDRHMAEWQRKHFGKESAKVPGVLAFPDPIPNSVWEQIKREFYKSDREGPRRHVLLMRNTGPGTPKWIQTYMSPAEMEFMKSRDWNRQEILNVLAPGLYTMLSPESTEANARVAKEMLRDSIWGLLVSLAEVIARDLLGAYGKNLTCAFDDVRTPDRTILLEEQKQYAVTHTINEVRERFYKDKPLEDPIGELLPAVVAPASLSLIGVPWERGQEEEQQDDLLPNAGPGSAPEKEPPAKDPELQYQQNEAQAKDLRLWRRIIKRNGLAKALRRGFIPDALPARTAAAITRQLHSMDDESALAFFDELLATKAARFLPLGADDPLPPVPAEVVISEQHINAVLRSWNRSFPVYRGLLDASVVNREQFDAQ